MSAATPEFVETPLASIPDRQVELVIIDRFRFQIERPADSYSLLDDPIVREAHERDEYMPYWADLWPAARMLAKAVLAEPWPSRQRTSEEEGQRTEDRGQNVRPPSSVLCPLSSVL